MVSVITLPGQDKAVDNHASSQWKVQEFCECVVTTKTVSFSY